MAEPSPRENKLQTILEVARNLAVVDDLDALLRMIVDATCCVLGCERATIFLYDPESDELYSRVATGDDSIRFPADRGIAGAAARERQVVNVIDAYTDARFNPDIDRRTGFRTRNLLTFPLESLSGELVGVLQALNKATPFNAEDEELARTLSAQAGVALQRWRLLQAYAVKERMARDLEIARSIQQSLFPRRNPRFEGYELAGWNQSADETGGDCYDFVRLADGRYAILLADATGHGIGAALVIAQFRSFARAMLSIGRSTSGIANSVNQLMAMDLKSERFVTAFIGIFDPVNHTLDYASAGQGPILVLTSDGAEARPSTGVPLAVAEEWDYHSDRITFAPGTLVALLTDGFYEALSPDSDQFGEQRVIEHLLQHRTSALEEVIEDLHQAVRDFSGRDSQHDDLTAVLLRRND